MPAAYLPVRAKRSGGGCEWRVPAEWDIREGGAVPRWPRVFKGKRGRAAPAMARGCAARGEDQSTGDDFITTRHSSTTLKYQKSGGLAQVWQAGDAVRRAEVFCTMRSSYTGLKRDWRSTRSGRGVIECYKKKSGARTRQPFRISDFKLCSIYPGGEILLAQAAIVEINSGRCRIRTNIETCCSIVFKNFRLICNQ